MKPARNEFNLVELPPQLPPAFAKEGMLILRRILKKATKEHGLSKRLKLRADDRGRIWLRDEANEEKPILIGRALQEEFLKQLLLRVIANQDAAYEIGCWMGEIYSGTKPSWRWQSIDKNVGEILSGRDPSPPTIRAREDRRRK